MFAHLDILIYNDALLGQAIKAKLLWLHRTRRNASEYHCLSTILERMSGYGLIIQSHLSQVHLRTLVFVGRRLNKSRMQSMLLLFVCRTYSSYVNNYPCSPITRTYCLCYHQVVSYKSRKTHCQQGTTMGSPSIRVIPGKQYIWADILTRWAAPQNSSFPSRRVGALQAWNGNSIRRNCYETSKGLLWVL